MFTFLNSNKFHHLGPPRPFAYYSFLGVTYYSFLSHTHLTKVTHT